MMPFMPSTWAFSARQKPTSSPELGTRCELSLADLDYPLLLALAQTTEPSLILFRHGNWSEADVVARLSEVLAGLSEQDIAQSILVVDRDRVRRRRLPIT
jgi:hypothetical protein